MMRDFQAATRYVFSHLLIIQLITPRSRAFRGIAIHVSAVRWRGLTICDTFFWLSNQKICRFLSPPWNADQIFFSLVNYLFTWEIMTYFLLTFHTFVRGKPRYGSEAWWQVVRAFDLRLEIAGSIPAAGLSSATLNKLFTHIVSVTKQYSLVLVKKRCMVLRSQKVSSCISGVALATRQKLRNSSLTGRQHPRLRYHGLWQL